MVGRLRRGTKEGISRNRSNLLWVTVKVTTGHGTQTHVFDTPGPMFSIRAGT